MTSTTKIIVIVIAIALMSMFFLPIMGEAETQDDEFYFRSTIVIDWKIEDDHLIVLCQDKEGNQWEFYEYENFWDEGDICLLKMWNNSDDITQHEIIETYYDGHMRFIEAVEWLYGIKSEKTV